MKTLNLHFHFDIKYFEGDQKNGIVRNYRTIYPEVNKITLRKQSQLPLLK